MNIELTLNIDGEKTKITKSNFNGEYKEILKLVEKAAMTHDYTVSDFLLEYADVIITEHKRSEVDLDDDLVGKVLIKSDDSIN